jgi:hypothetical protein
MLRNDPTDSTRTCRYQHRTLFTVRFAQAVVFPCEYSDNRIRIDVSG